MSAADWRSGGPHRAGDDGPADVDRPDDYEPPSRRAHVDPPEVAAFLEAPYTPAPPPSSAPSSPTGRAPRSGRWPGMT